MASVFDFLKPQAPRAQPTMNDPMGGMGFMQRMQYLQQNSPETLVALGAGMMQGNMGQGFSNAASAYGQHRKDARDQALFEREEAEKGRNQNMTRRYLIGKGYDPTEVDAAMANPAILNSMLKGKENNYINAGDGSLFNETTGEWIRDPARAQQPATDYDRRVMEAEKAGLTQDDPRYESFVLTGKMPREDAQPLTATDKKAILEADEMVAANENAIAALEQAEALSGEANAGWLAGERAWLGNNLPDLMVPDFISSPDSSESTASMDNAVIGQALTSLKALFGAAPTEGERKILLDLQGSSSMPRNVRAGVFARARAAAERRLEFNRQRAEQLRGGGFYKPGGGGQMQGQPAPQTGARRTSSGISYTIE